MQFVQKAWRSAITVSVFNAITLGSGMSISFASPTINVTVGDIDGTSVKVHDGLGVGRTWEMYDLNTKEYIGSASVTASRMVKRWNCSYSAAKGDLVPESTLVSKQRRASSSVLLIRAVPDVSTSVQLRAVSFSQLPQSFQRYLLQSVSDYQRKYVKSSEFTTVDLDKDNSPDVIYTKGNFPAASSRTIHVRFNSTWVEKYQNYCEAGC